MRGEHGAERESRWNWAAVAVLGVVVACAPALGDLLDGGQGDITLVDEDNGLRAELEESGCEADGDAMECEYDVTLEGDGTEEYTLTLRYEADGALTVVDGTDAYGQSLEDEVVVVPGGMAPGDSEDASHDGDDYEIEYDAAGETEDDADGDEHAGCDVYAYSFPDGESADLTICSDVGIVRISGEGFDLRREL